MRTVTTLPYAVQEEEHVWIPVSDGTHLAARIWRPTAAGAFPAVLEFIPYRKRDLTAVRDSTQHPYLAGHGYACVRVDLRGSGDSEGVLEDEYLERELQDAEEIIEWLSRQPWCTGRVGMMGISWGGFNALQVAARGPEALRAIATLCSSDDRYADDVHYMGGCLLSDNLSWAATMFAYTAAPPDPALVGDCWREMWLGRMEHSGHWLRTWLGHQRRDEYWRRGSVCEDYAAIRCPVLAVSGWADGYSNAVFRLLENLDVPRLGLIGPWSHKYPQLGEPGPAIGFLQELVRWWDRWLKDADNDIMDEPMLRVWLQESVPPSTSYAERPGRWVAEPGWPSERITERVLPLARASILAEGDRPGTEELTIESPLSVGQFAGKWCSYSAPPDLPYDQREEDGGSLIFDTAPLAGRTEVVGAPAVDIELVPSEPLGLIAIRLSDVAEDGKATRVTFGLLNLAHRHGHDAPEPMVPGERHRTRVVLNGVAHAFPPGHRMRLSISTSYWPLAWPPPRPCRLSLLTGESALRLPVRPVEAQPYRGLEGEAEGTPPIATTRIRPGEEHWTVSRDLVDYDSALNVVKDLGEIRLDDIGLKVSRRATERYGWTGDDFTSVYGDVSWAMGFARDGWAVTTVTRTRLNTTDTAFQLHASLDAYEGDARVVSRNWNLDIPRDHL